MHTILTTRAKVRAGLRRNAARVTARLGGPLDRGDVPGWVLVTIMTAGLVTALWALAGPQLGSLFSDAISDVKGP